MSEDEIYTYHPSLTLSYYKFGDRVRQTDGQIATVVNKGCTSDGTPFVVFMYDDGHLVERITDVHRLIGPPYPPVQDDL